MLVSLFGHRFWVEQGTPSTCEPSAVGCGSEKEEGRWRYVREKSSPLPWCGGGGPEGWSCCVMRGSPVECQGVHPTGRMPILLAFIESIYCALDIGAVQILLSFT